MIVFFKKKIKKKLKKMGNIFHSKKIFVKRIELGYTYIIFSEIASVSVLGFFYIKRGKELASLENVEIL